MDVAFPAMVGGVGVGELGEPRAGILCQRMEEGEVHQFGDELDVCQLGIMAGKDGKAACKLTYQDDKKRNAPKSDGTGEGCPVHCCGDNLRVR